MNRILTMPLISGIIALGLFGCRGGEDPHLNTLNTLSNVVTEYRSDIGTSSSLDATRGRYTSYNTEVRGLVDQLGNRSGRMTCDSQGMSEMMSRMHGELDRYAEVVANLNNLEEMKEECERHSENMADMVGECEGMHGGRMHHRMGGG